MKEGKKKSVGARDVLFLFLLVVGILLLVLYSDGSDKSTKMNWGIGAGLGIASISYFVDRIITKVRAILGDNQIIFVIVICAFLISGFIMLCGYNDGPDDWRLLALGTGLWVGGPMVLAKQADVIQSKTITMIGILGLISVIVCIVVELVIA